MPRSIGSDFPIRRLCDVGVGLLDCEHATPSPAEDGYPYVAIPDVKNGRIDLGQARRISRADFERWTRRTKPQAGDVIVTRRGRVGDSAVVPEGAEVAIGQNLVILRSDGEQVDQRYLRWLVRSPAYWREVDRYLNVGAVFSSLNCGEIPLFELPVPPLPTQREIADILGVLDDKIELNRRIAATAHELAHAIFRARYRSDDPALPHEPLGEHLDVARGLSYTGSGLADEGVPLHNLDSIVEGGGTTVAGSSATRGRSRTGTSSTQATSSSLTRT